MLTKLLTGTGIMYRAQIFNIVLGFKQREYEVGTTLYIIIRQFIGCYLKSVIILNSAKYARSLYLYYKTLITLK